MVCHRPAEEIVDGRLKESDPTTERLGRQWRMTASARWTTSGVPLNVAVLKSTDSQKSYILGRWVAQST